MRKRRENSFNINHGEENLKMWPTFGEADIITHTHTCAHRNMSADLRSERSAVAGIIY